MSPELIQEKSCDSKFDIRSLGSLIYKLCVLKPPFHEAKIHLELNIFIWLATIKAYCTAESTKGHEISGTSTTSTRYRRQRWDISYNDDAQKDENQSRTTLRHMGPLLRDQAAKEL
ncbi:hypothetical protein CVT25_015183 [Psilocybe cyanescens]|uniref:Protein kinase domain-containing protein n=1 Tax=Psilocybe cyanescens TaxID=93625 RepID=A0A409VZ57_PSICY|nr:hypothetical protein CVT25_015183 [Psilocybe cyanescens]